MKSQSSVRNNSTVSLHVSLILVYLTSISALTSCAMDGEKCSVPRDCCSPFECTEQDWAVTSDYLCMRKTPKPTNAEYIERLRRFYESVNPGKAANELNLVNVLQKWEGREERMFHVLREKYHVHDEL
mmetsp:Transcript_7314/g.12330  ORF Transcript_7314/g.12330 Transcript_7314/m.12330 type:complete len:128 (+) Transcript_7314:29-412(+)